MIQVPVKILGVSGSPIKDGNCDKLVQVSLEAAREINGVETEFITLAQKKIACCEHCQYCIKNRTSCQIKDDAQPILDMITAADGIIFGAPSWLRTLAPPLMNLMSRTRNIRFFTGEWRNKVTGSLVVGWFGTGTEKTLWTIDDIMRGAMMIPVAQGWAVASTAAFGQRADYMEHGVLDDKAGINRARQAGIRVVEVAKLIRHGLSSDLDLPPATLTTGARLKPAEKKAPGDSLGGDR